MRASLERLAWVIERRVDLDALLAIARRAPRTTVPDPPRAQWVGRARIAVGAGQVFSFVYPENLELLRQAGAELVTFDPLRERALPADCAGLYLAGGFPEVFASELAQNRPLLDSLRQRIGSGVVTWAECGGLLLFCDALDARAMAGVLPGVHARMTDRLTLGYRTATTRTTSPFGPAGRERRGHEYHRSVTDPTGEALELKGRFASALGGFSTPTLFATDLHQHLAATPPLAEAFVTRAAGTNALVTRPGPA